MKENFIKLNYNFLYTEYKVTPKGVKCLVYVCKCKSSHCSNNVRIWSNSSIHSGYCNDCTDVLKRRKPYASLYQTFLNAQIRRNIAVTLSFGEFSLLCKEEKCHYCGAPTIRDKHRQKKQSNAYMIDRKDNIIGYTIDNCVTCCFDCNNLKSNKFSYIEFLKLRQFIKNEFNR